MDPALTLNLDHRVGADQNGHATAAELAHDTLVAMGYRIEIVDGVIYRLKR